MARDPVIMKISLIVLCLAAVVIAKNEVYQGYKSYYVTVTSAEQQKLLGTLTGKYYLDFLSHAVIGRDGVVLVAPQFQADFTKELQENGVEFRVHSDDVKKALDDEDIVNEQSRASSRMRTGRSVPYDNYQEWEVIDNYVQELGRRYPDRVTVVQGGISFEGRPIRYLKISSSNFQDTSKPVIFIDGGIHSREWVSPPTVTWALHKLVEDITENDMANDVDWIILPVVNPDGYVYTFTNERFWRKTRSTHHQLGNFCPGADGNRNYDFAWDTTGTSPIPCADTFAGASAFSEPETRVVRDIILEYRDRMPLYITMHSYGSMILYPWGHDGSLSWNALLIHSTGIAMAQAMDRLSHSSFPNYIVGNSAMVIGYAASGASEDWAHSVGIPLAYTFELPGLSGGFEGFHLPPQWIEQVCEETWAGIVAGARNAISLYYSKK